MRLGEHVLSRFGRGTVVAWLVAIAAWFGAVMLLWPTVQGVPPDPRRTELALSLLWVALTTWLLGAALHKRSQPGGGSLLLLPLAFHVIAAVLVDLLAVLIALLLLTSMRVGVIDNGLEVLAADLGLVQGGITFLGMIVAIIVSTISPRRREMAHRER